MQLIAARSAGAGSLTIVNGPATLGRLLDVDPGSAIVEGHIQQRSLYETKSRLERTRRGDDMESWQRQNARQRTSESA